MSGYMNYAVPRESTQDLIPFFRKLEATQNELEIHDIQARHWMLFRNNDAIFVQLSLTTLEEVFLTIAENAELKNLEAKMKKNALEVKKQNEKKKGKEKEVEMTEIKSNGTQEIG
jgi:hypothetical protein